MNYIIECQDEYGQWDSPGESFDCLFETPTDAEKAIHEIDQIFKSSFQSEEILPGEWTKYNLKWRIKEIEV